MADPPNMADCCMAFGAGAVAGAAALGTPGFCRRCAIDLGSFLPPVASGDPRGGGAFTRTGSNCAVCGGDCRSCAANGVESTPAPAPAWGANAGVVSGERGRVAPWQVHDCFHPPVNNRGTRGLTIGRRRRSSSAFLCGVCQQPREPVAFVVLRRSCGCRARGLHRLTGDRLAKEIGQMIALGGCWRRRRLGLRGAGRFCGSTLQKAH